jgi:hypothetical protein
MRRIIIWRDDTKTDGNYYSLLDAVTREPVIGEDGEPLTELSFKQAMKIFEELTCQQES